MKRATVISTVLFALTGAVLLGPSAAGAAVLCEANESPCTTENVLESEAQASLSGTMNFGTAFTCGVSLVPKVTDVGGEGKAVTTAVTLNLLFCRDFIGFCSSASVANLPYGGNFLGTGGNGSMVLFDPVEIKLQLKCPQGTCTIATTKEIEFQFTGGAPAAMSATGVAMESGSCTTTMSSELKSLSPFSLFIVGGAAPNPATRLCKVSTSPCPKAERYAIGTVVEASLEGSSVFEFLYEGKPREPGCEEGALAGKTTALGGPLIGEVSAMSFKKCGAGVCAVEAQSLPYTAEILKTGGGNGTLYLLSGGGGPPKIEVNCGKSFKCIYKATYVGFAVTGSSTAPKLAVSQTMEKDAASEAECGSTMTWKAIYKVSKPTPLFVT